jgi:hypothetical protein
LCFIPLQLHRRLYTVFYRIKYEKFWNINFWFFLLVKIRSFLEKTALFYLYLSKIWCFNNDISQGNLKKSNQCVTLIPTFVWALPLMENRELTSVIIHSIINKAIIAIRLKVRIFDKSHQRIWIYGIQLIDKHILFWSIIITIVVIIKSYKKLNTDTPLPILLQ